MEKEEVKKMYKEFFKKKGITLNDFEFEKTDNSTNIFLHFYGKIFYMLKIYTLIDLAEYSRFVKDDVENDIDVLEKNQMANPTIPKIVDAISVDYKSVVKEKGLVKQLASRFLEEELFL